MYLSLYKKLFLKFRELNRELNPKEDIYYYTPGISSGFTFIEVMVAVVIISITAIGIMHGTVHSRGMLRSLELRERATEELTNYMEYWQGRVADDRLSMVEKAGDNLGKQIYLVGNSNSNLKVPAKLYYNLVKQNSKYNSPVYNAYKIKVWITWQDYFLQENDPYYGDVVHERILETVMIAYN